MTRGEAFRRVQEEIRRAQAEALGRTGERLEAILHAVAEQDRRLDALLSGASSEGLPSGGVAAAVEARERLRGEAVRLAQTLVIQREALGMTRHGLVAERYPIPPRRSGFVDHEKNCEIVGYLGVPETLVERYLR